MSSATTGFFQQTPVLVPRHGSTSEDPVVGQMLRLYFAPGHREKLSADLAHVTKVAGSRIIRQHNVDAELYPPILRQMTVFGQENRVDALHTTASWSHLKNTGIALGSVSRAYRPRQAGVNHRLEQFLVNHLWTPSSGMTSCPAAMTDGAALLIGQYLRDDDDDQPGRGEFLREAYRRLTSSDPEQAWTSGQWMTERTGGSDVSGTETRAVRVSDGGVDAAGLPLGPWSIDGFKWFSSATDSDMVVLLAQTELGLSLFCAPLRRREADLVVTNGVRISRLKNKLGTKSLPTAELELKGMRGWMLGSERRGVKAISTVLNTTRLWTGAGGVSGLAHGLTVARAYARVRKVRGRLLADNPQHLAWLAEEVVKYQAAAHLAFYGCALMGVAEGAEPTAPWLEGAEAGAILRIITPVIKSQCSLAGCLGLRECMESLGGVGYCENVEDAGVFNLARAFRDSAVNCIWEGTSTVMAEDLVRALRGAKALDVLDRVFEGLLDDGDLARLLRDQWLQTRARVEAATEVQARLVLGRWLLRELETLLSGSLLLAAARELKDGLLLDVARRWLSTRVHRAQLDGHDAQLDRCIVYGLQTEEQRQHHAKAEQLQSSARL
ncbi:hypothetical protein PYCC9005_005796 [Savitreella phatthalungensis]